MSPDVVEALQQLKSLTTCRCDAAYTDRNLHHPTECCVEYRDDVETVERALREG